LCRSERRLHIREMKSLGGRQFLVVAEYEGRRMLLGVCPGRIEHLCELPAVAVEPEFPKIEPPKPL
jgi:flagellar protein FliO/FliZ